MVAAVHVPIDGVPSYSHEGLDELQDRIRRRIERFSPTPITAEFGPPEYYYFPSQGCSGGELRVSFTLRTGRIPPSGVGVVGIHEVKLKAWQYRIGFDKPDFSYLPSKWKLSDRHTYAYIFKHLNIRCQGDNLSQPLECTNLATSISRDEDGEWAACRECKQISTGKKIRVWSET